MASAARLAFGMALITSRLYGDGRIPSGRRQLPCASFTRAARMDTVEETLTWWRRGCRGVRRGVYRNIRATRAAWACVTERHS